MELGVRPDLSQCRDGELADAVVQLHALETAVAAQKMAVIAECDRRDAFRADGATSMAAWLTGQLGVSFTTARSWVDVSARLADLPAVSAAFGQARLSFDHVRPLTRFVGAADDADWAERAQGLSAAQCEQAARHARLIPDDEVTEAQRRRSITWRYRHDRSWLEITGLLPTDTGASLVHHLTRLAAQAPADPATGMHEPFESRCADALSETVSTAMAAERDADRATVVMHVDSGLLIGGAGTADLDDGPTLHPAVARRIACDCRLELTVEGADGEALGTRSAKRVASAPLLRSLRRRDRGCRFPGCERRRWVHAHHLQHWIDGGPTTSDNLALLCVAHHHLVHEGGWKLTGSPDADLTFVRPDGRELTTPPPTLTPTTRKRMQLLLPGLPGTDPPDKDPPSNVPLDRDPTVTDPPGGNPPPAQPPGPVP